MTVRAWHDGVLWVGLGGTVVLVLAGFRMLLSRVWAASITQVLEVGVASPFLGAWVLSPLLWVARPRGASPGSRGGDLTSLLAVTLVVGLGAYAYLPEFLLLPVVFDAELGLDSLLLALIVPAGQWVILAAAGIVRFLQERGRA